MKTVCALLLLSLSTASVFAGEWMTLFDGSSLDGWKAAETEGCFSIVDGDTLKVAGGRSHLFWMGTDAIPAEFTDFELRMKVKTTPGANSGVFFHTTYQEEGWPTQGYEAQVNTSHKDPRKTASIYAVKDVMDEAPSKDNEWFDYIIRVQGKTITISVDGQVVNEFTEPENYESTDPKRNRKLGSGTIAIQGHDPKSVTFYRAIQIKSL